jgi:hypothetical protein
LFAVYDLDSCLLHNGTYVVFLRSVWSREQASCFILKTGAKRNEQNETCIFGKITCNRFSFFDIFCNYSTAQKYPNTAFSFRTLSERGWNVVLHIISVISNRSRTIVVWVKIEIICIFLAYRMANKLYDRPYLVLFSGISLSIYNSSCDHRNFDSVNSDDNFIKSKHSDILATSFGTKI